MNVSADEANLVDKSGDLVVAWATEAKEVFGRGAFGRGAKEIDKALKGELAELAGEEKFSGKKGEVLILWTRDKLAAKRVAVIGLGKEEEINDESLRRGMGQAIQAAKKYKCATVVAEVVLSQGIKAGGYAMATGAILADYEFDKYQSQEAQDSRTLIKEIVLVGKLGPNSGAEIDRAIKACEGVTWARDLVNEPPVVVTPTYLVKQAEALTKKSSRISVKVYDEAKLRAMGANAILAVSRGSDEPAYLIHLVYKPKVTAKKRIAILGKGLTFDSGGYSLKPQDGMQTMKLDMAGAAAVLGLFKILASADVNVEVHGIIPTSENLVSGKAIKPGDIIKTLGGKTVEILNTDAEGRLILADALDYISKESWDGVIDLATLTGACMVALGEQVAGLFSNNEELQNKLMEAAKSEGEMVWPLPLVEEYKELIKSQVAEIQNISKSKWGGAITAALFLQEFVPQGMPWAHVDIAGPAFEEKGNVLSYVPMGGTGFGVRTLIRFLEKA